MTKKASLKTVSPEAPAVEKLCKLTIEEAAKLAPAILAKKPAADVSEKYTFIPTGPILEAAQSEGWEIIKAGQPCMSGDFRASSQHTVTMIHKDHLADYSKIRSRGGHEIKKDGFGEGFPTVTIVNSHDRSRRLNTLVGFYRLVCSNGLMMPIGLSQQMKLTHMHVTVDSVLETLRGVLGCAGEIAEHVNSLRGRKLSNPERGAFAAYGMELRYQGWAKVPVTPKMLLEVRREEDREPTLWNTFNVVQENLVRGGFPSAYGRTVRGIAGFHDSLRVNRGLWTGAEALLTGGVAKLMKVRRAVRGEKEVAK